MWYDISKRGGITVANRRKYTSARALRRDICKYLKSIRTDVRVYETDLLGEYVRDADGAKVPLFDGDGKPVTVEGYVVPPDLRDIAHAVGMSYDTWLKYASGEYDDESNRFSEVCAEARELCIRSAMRAVTLGGKGAAGRAWSLKVNFGIGSDEKESDKGGNITVTINSPDGSYEE